MAPTTLNGFHHIETDKTGMKTISQIFGGLRSGDSNLPYSKLPKDSSCDYFSSNKKSSPLNSAERIGVGLFKSCFSTSRSTQNRPKDHDTSYLFGTPPSKTDNIITTERPRVLGIRDSLNRQQSNINEKPRVVLRSRPRDHDISYLYGTLKPKVDKVKIIEKPPVSVTGRSENLSKIYPIKDEPKVIVKRPNDHDKSYLFGVQALKNEEIKNHRHLSAPRTRGIGDGNQNYFAKEISTSERQRPRDNATSYLFGPGISKDDESRVQKQRSAPTERQPPHLPKQQLPAERPKLILLRPRDHDTSYLFGSNASKNNEIKNLRQLSDPVRIQDLGKDNSSKGKPRGLVYHPKDHDNSYLFGAPVSKSNCAGFRQHLKPSKTAGSPNLPKGGSTKSKPRVVMNRPMDHSNSYLFGAGEPVTEKMITKETKLMCGAPKFQSNCQGYGSKIRHCHPKDYDNSYTFGASELHRDNYHNTESQFSNEVHESQSPSIKNLVNIKHRIAVNRPKDHDKSYLFGTPVPKNDQTEIIESASGINESLNTSINTSAKGKPRVIINRPKDHDCSYFFGTSTFNVENNKPKQSTGFRMKGLKNIFPSTMKSDVSRVIRNGPIRNRKPVISREPKKSRINNSKISQGESEEIKDQEDEGERHLKEHKITNVQHASPIKAKKKEKSKPASPEVRKEQKLKNQEQENIKADPNIHIGNSHQNVKKLSQETNNKSSVYQRLSQSYKPMCKQFSARTAAKKPLLKKRENGESKEKKQTKCMENGHEKELEELK